MIGNLSRRGIIVAIVCFVMALIGALIVGNYARSQSPQSAGKPDAGTIQSGAPFVSTTCADLVIMGVRGSGQDAGKNDGVGKEVSRSARAMVQRLRTHSKATVRLEPVNYEASAASSLKAYDESVAAGTRALDAQFGSLAKKCRRSRFVLLGFSQGAQVVHKFAAGLTDRRAERLAVIAMIADPLRDPGDDIKLWSYGGKTPTGHGRVGTGHRFNRATSPLAITFCVSADEVCNQTRPPGSGADSPTHKHFYETPEHSRSTGEQLDRMLTRN